MADPVLEKRTCEYVRCQRRFTPKRPHGRHCSSTCRKAAAREKNGTRQRLEAAEYRRWAGRHELAADRLEAEVRRLQAEIARLNERAVKLSASAAREAGLAARQRARAYRVENPGGEWAVDRDGGWAEAAPDDGDDEVTDGLEELPLDEDQVDAEAWVKVRGVPP